jgi:hypothetical protein
MIYLLRPFRAPPPKLMAQRFMIRARQYRHAANQLADMHGPEPNWPKWFLETHAIELAIRAFFAFREESRVPPPAASKPKKHDLVGLYNHAVLWGLPRNQLVTKDLPHLSELHQDHYARYPKELQPVTLIAHFDDMVDQLIDGINKAILFR